jgi:hypothetical protein
MQVFSKIAFAAVAAAIVVPASAEPTIYGRAGSPVGAERIQQVAQTAGPAPTAEFDPGYGRAGGAVVTAQARPVKSATNVEVAAQWFGRNGGPLPFGG